jgi:hypothetical protein
MPRSPVHSPGQIKGEVKQTGFVWIFCPQRAVEKVLVYCPFVIVLVRMPLWLHTEDIIRIFSGEVVDIYETVTLFGGICY